MGVSCRQGLMAALAVLAHAGASRAFVLGPQGALLRPPPCARARTTAGGCRGVHAAQEGVKLDGRVLFPGSEGTGWWDDRTTAMPVVLPPDAAAGRRQWTMFYYGRAQETWNKGNPAFLPTGSSGVATSEDGLTWTRVKGPLRGGAVMHPSDEEGALDEIQLGVTDVLPKEGGGFVMHYLGGSAEAISMGTAPGMGALVGFRMRCLAAESEDGLHWQRRAEPVVDVGPAGEWDCLFASWPRAVPCDPEEPSGQWLVTYHALQPTSSPDEPARWAMGGAVTDARYGLRGTVKLGRGLEGGGEGAWDERGIGTRHVIHRRGALYMLYEGVNAAGVHAIGLARSDDKGRSWVKEEVPGKEEPGGPVFEARRGEEAWDNRVVGTPWVTQAPGGYRLYYIGTSFGSESGATTGIGCAESVGDSLCEWRRVPAR